MYIYITGRNMYIYIESPRCRYLVNKGYPERWILFTEQVGM